MMFDSMMRGDDHVSILTQPEGWVPSDLGVPIFVRTTVSILTQPEGWVP